MSIQLFFSTLVCFCICISFAADPAEAAELPQTVTGRVAETKELIATARRTLGDHGVLAIRSAERCKAIETQLVALGWKPPAEPNLGQIDFDNQMLVLIYKNGDVADTFSLRPFDEAKRPKDLDIVMSYIIYKARGEVVERCNFIIAIVPRQPKLEVTVSTYHPANGGPFPTPEKAQLEWRGEVGAESGDIVDSLRGKIEAAEARVAKGKDIEIKFTLEHAGGDQVKAGRFANQNESVFVWDGKYSNGYRNHAFEVRTPDGKTHFLRPKEILNWDKNAPHPEEIRAGQSYVLPGWQFGMAHKSLAALGLATSLPGKYAITGIYLEAAESAKKSGREFSIWGGNIATGTIEVDVVEAK